jgi:hypothetical protein
VTRSLPDNLVAPGHLPAKRLGRLIRNPDFRQKAACIQLSEDARLKNIIQSILHSHLIPSSDAIEDVRTEEAAAGALAILGRVGEGHAVVGRHGVDLVVEDLHDDLEEG